MGWFYSYYLYETVCGLQDEDRSHSYRACILVNLTAGANKRGRVQNIRSSKSSVPQLRLARCGVNNGYIDLFEYLLILPGGERVSTPASNPTPERERNFTLEMKITRLAEGLMFTNCTLYTFGLYTHCLQPLVSKPCL